MGKRGRNKAGKGFDLCKDVLKSKRWNRLFLRGSCTREISFCEEYRDQLIFSQVRNANQEFNNTSNRSQDQSVDINLQYRCFDLMLNGVT